MGSREEEQISVHQKATSPGISHPSVGPCPRTWGDSGHLVMPSNEGVGVARAACGNDFCHLDKNETKGGLSQLIQKKQEEELNSQSTF